MTGLTREWFYLPVAIFDSFPHIPLTIDLQSFYCHFRTSLGVVHTRDDLIVLPYWKTELPAIWPNIPLSHINTWNKLPEKNIRVFKKLLKKITAVCNKRNAIQSTLLLKYNLKDLNQIGPVLPSGENKSEHAYPLWAG